MPQSKEEIEIETWHYLKHQPLGVVVLVVLERVFNNADYAKRMRSQKIIDPTIARDFEEFLVGDHLKKANAASSAVIREMKNLGASVSRKEPVDTVGQMRMKAIKVRIDLSRVRLRVIKKQLAELRSEMRRKKISRKGLKAAEAARVADQT